MTAVTINRVCISGMEAVLSGMAMIQAGMVDVVLAGGVEHMSGVAYQVPNARWGCRLQDKIFVDALMRSLHCGSHLIPHPEDGPVDSEKAPLSFFKGKPYIIGTNQFNISHSGNLIVCAFSESKIGIDIEKIRNVNIENFRSYFSDDEYTDIANSSAINKLFFQYWKNLK